MIGDGLLNWKRGVNSIFEPHRSTIRQMVWQVGEQIHRTEWIQRLLCQDHNRPQFEQHRSKYFESRFKRTLGPIFPTPSPVVENPVLTADAVTDYGRVDSVADPFLLVTDDRWHMFFEVHNHEAVPSAVIGHALSHDAGVTWSYNGVVLKTDDHLSFPFVFRHDNWYYMLPDAWSKSEVPAPISLYRTRNLPDGWSKCATLVRPTTPIHDCIVFQWRDRWWALTGNGQDLYCYHSPNLVTNSWDQHPENPVASGRPEASRPAGRPHIQDDGIVVYLQDCNGRYGRNVRAYRINTLTRQSYQDVELQYSPVLEADPCPVGWNSGKMHHIDTWPLEDGWRCVVDGNVGFGRSVVGDNHWSIGIYDQRVPTSPNSYDPSLITERHDI
ncbi:glucosamine inositolphosphorylceramide transferase family protein [Halorussus limi]|uniref:glucosamine inositolphosphorylceramide transferase family protein n=1 Tax=Halorussus limi TaxID=2938695 RepID=UPI003F5F79E2